MFITSFEEQSITYRSCSNFRIHLSYEDIHGITSFLWNLKNGNKETEHIEEANILLYIITSRHITFSGKKKFI